MKISPEFKGKYLQVKVTGNADDAPALSALYAPNLMTSSECLWDWVTFRIHLLIRPILRGYVCEVSFFHFHNLILLVLSALPSVRSPLYDTFLFDMKTLDNYIASFFYFLFPKMLLFELAICWRWARDKEKK